MNPQDCVNREHQEVLLAIQESRKESQLEWERMNGELKALGTRVQVWEGFINSSTSRLHTRLDALQAELKEQQKGTSEKDLIQQREIDTLKLHSKYVAGIAVGIGLLLTYLDKIIRLFTGGKP